MAKLHIQGASANHVDNRKPMKSPAKLPIQGSSANYAGMKKSGRTTPSPAAKPYPPTKPPPQNAHRRTPTSRKGK